MVFSILLYVLIWKYSPNSVPSSGLVIIVLVLGTVVGINHKKNCRRFFYTNMEKVFAELVLFLVGKARALHRTPLYSYTQ